MHLIPEPTSKALAICFAVLVSLACFGRVSAATLADYRHRVSEATALIEQLQAASDDQDQSQREHFVITRVREDLPAKETVMFNSESVAVDNTWLYEALQDYAQTNRRQAQRRAALNRIEERLRAIKERLEEMQAGTASASDKDGAKGRLAEILRRPDYNRPATTEDSAIGRLWKRLLRWFLSLFRTSSSLTPRGSPFVARVLQIIILAACLGAIAFVVWKFVPTFLGRRRGKKKHKREARIVLGERLEPDQTAADLLAQAESLARNGDLRGAIRKAYIALLCELGDRKIVSLAQHKTNRDYLNSVRERTQLYSSMRRLTSSFELHWYGFQPPAENDWHEFLSGYQQTLKAGSRQ